MPELTIWRLPSPDPRTHGHVVVRGQAGVCYSLPEMIGAWPVLCRVRHESGRRYLDLLRWPDGLCPAGEPLPEAEASPLAPWLGLPESVSAESSEGLSLVQVAEEILAKLEAVEREIAAAASARPGVRHEDERPRRRLNFAALGPAIAERQEVAP